MRVISRNSYVERMFPWRKWTPFPIYLTSYRRNIAMDKLLNANQWNHRFIYKIAVASLTDLGDRLPPKISRNKKLKLVGQSLHSFLYFLCSPPEMMILSLLAVYTLRLWCRVYQFESVVCPSLHLSSAWGEEMYLSLGFLFLGLNLLSLVSKGAFSK